MKILRPNNNTEQRKGNFTLVLQSLQIDNKNSYKQSPAALACRQFLRNALLEPFCNRVLIQTGIYFPSWV